MSFEKEIFHLANCKETLSRIKNSAHAIILAGKDELFLDTIAKLIVLQDECQFVTTPCFECSNCKKVINGNALDVEVFVYLKNIIVADSSKIVEDNYIVPIEFKKKYFILKNFDMATEQAQNKLLKVVEEPRIFVKFIILTTNINAILPTIKSRAEVYNIPALTNDEIFDVLKNNYSSKEQLKKVILYSNGNLSKCIKFLEDENNFEIHELAEKLIMFMNSTANMLEYTSAILCFKDKIVDFLEILREKYIDLLKIKSNISADIMNFNKLKVVSVNYSTNAIVKIVEQINLAISKIKIKISANEVIDNLLLKILEVKYLCK